MYTQVTLSLLQYNVQALKSITMFNHFTFRSQPGPGLDAEAIDPAHNTGVLSPRSNNDIAHFGKTEKAVDMLANPLSPRHPPNRFRIGRALDRRPAPLVLDNDYQKRRRISVSSITHQMRDQTLRDDPSTTTNMGIGRDEKMMKDRFDLSQCPPTPPISIHEWDMEDENESPSYGFRGNQQTYHMHANSGGYQESMNESRLPPSPQLSESSEPPSPSLAADTTAESYQNLRDRRQCLSMIQCATTTVPETIRLALAIDRKCSAYEADNVFDDGNINVSHPGELPSSSSRSAADHPAKSLQRNYHARACRRSKGINKARRSVATRQPAVTPQHSRRRSLVLDLLTGFMEKE